MNYLMPVSLEKTKKTKRNIGKFDPVYHPVYQFLHLFVAYTLKSEREKNNECFPFTSVYVWPKIAEIYYAVAVLAGFPPSVAVL